MITEIFKSDNSPVKLEYHYSTNSTYDVKIEQTDQAWIFTLSLQILPQVLEKRASGVLFDPVVENAKCFKYTLDGHEAAYLQIGMQSWNNRMRIWDILVKNDFRGKGIGAELIQIAKDEAAKAGARMLVLETQSCNVPAIQFYLKHGFQLIGFDVAHYTNDDIRRREFRLEFGFVI